MSDINLARQNMVESQVHTADVTDRRILRALGQLPREIFVPSSMRSIAYMDEHIKLTEVILTSSARFLMSSMPLAKLVQLANINSTDLVLDIGCTTGYSTALLSKLADSVVGLDADQNLTDQATKNLMTIGADNSAIVVGPHRQGYSKEGPYDVIFINGAVPYVSDEIFSQLKENGRLVMVLSETDFGKACLFTKSQNSISQKSYFDVSVPILPGFKKEKDFVF
ncbi:MAG: protein-L-isoaspartate O-methyltransferase [Pseudomonadota bacterium]